MCAEAFAWAYSPPKHVTRAIDLEQDLHSHVSLLEQLSNDFRQYVKSTGSLHQNCRHTTDFNALDRNHQTVNLALSQLCGYMTATLEGNGSKASDVETDTANTSPNRRTTSNIIREDVQRHAAGYDFLTFALTVSTAMDLWSDQRK